MESFFSSKQLQLLLNGKKYSVWVSSILAWSSFMSITCFVLATFIYEIFIASEINHTSVWYLLGLACCS